MSNLGQHLKFSNGKTSPNRTDTGFYPVYGANGIIGYSSEYNSDENTIIIGRVGSYCGSVHFSDKKCWVTDNAISARSMNLKESIFWFYYLKSLNLNSMRVGSGQPLLNQTILKSISLPDLNINKIKVGEILLSFDQKIDLNTQINQTLEQIAQALFKSWFVDFDPVRAKVQALSDGLSLEQAELAAMQAISGKTPEELTALSQTQPDRYAELAETAKAFPCEIVEIDGVEVPKGWNLKALDKIANYQNGLALQKFRPEDDEPFLPVVKIAQLRQGYADGEEKAKASIKPECIIDNGDVIFSWSGSLLVDIWCGGKAALNQHLFKVTSKRYPKWFYYFYTKYHLAEFQRIAYDKAVTMGHIKREHLSAAKCIVPNDELLANKTLENILEKIIFNRLENFNLQDTRDLLLPRLLNGDIQNE
ncbi:type I restriction modification DNA specificity domain protein [Haemophilus pittmaniae HK 85]|uniref:Type I restriction modification DNA specificity domain protein n=1 Tax=Haemophilus pittmaniae HK 85 TaxID=1035188 RepID=F9Q7T4_9PAST|nr:restriction endonuclease subunit S [Haemophilus pittmaniae]EGV06338.1 type I restriction modification DNA specificity domain protein [Haemophilus pittmaniae HK 85]SNV80183.1 type I restriction enzyme HindVIIP specificity protein [Haemophilus pittmaniae]